MAALPTGTVTFLFTDIEGSTTLLQRLGDRRYAEVLAEHRHLLRKAFAEGNGQEIDTQGDAFLVTFSRARDAVATAVAAQQSLMKNTLPDGALLQMQMALHTGECCPLVQERQHDQRVRLEPGASADRLSLEQVLLGPLVVSRLQRERGQTIIAREHKLGLSHLFGDL